MAVAVLLKVKTPDHGFALTLNIHKYYVTKSLL